MGRPKLPASHFWTRIDKSGGPNACWICNWATVGGYGVYHSKKAHRVAWELTNGPIPRGLQVLHDCPGGDNPMCCNPLHLWLGTEQDNMTDKVEKGRQSCGEKHAKIMKRVASRGEGHARATLTNELVLSIRRDYRKGVRGCGAHVLAKKYSVARQTILWIVNRKGWTHLE